MQKRGPWELKTVPNDAVVRRGVREVEPEDWGKVLLEELLFQGALAASDGATGTIEVRLTFSLQADTARRVIEIATPGSVEEKIVTRLPVD